MRILEVVNELGGNMSEFARKIDVTPAYISKLGKQPEKCRPSGLVISSICREFNVNRDWLVTGEGEMFADESATVLDALAAKYGLSRDARSLVEEFVSLKPDIQQVFVDYALKVARSIASEGDESGAIPQPEPDAAPLAGKDIPVPATAVDLAAKVAELERQNKEIQRQNQELSARLAAMEEEDELFWHPDTGNLA